MFPGTVNERMKALIEAKLPKYGRFQELERLTKIKNATWQTWARGRQRPTDRMIEAIACIWPEHAYWLVTGDELPREGMTNPTKQLSRELQTLTEFTARTLSTRLAIRNELMAHLDYLSTLDEGDVNTAMDALAGNFVKRFIELEDTGQDTNKINDDQYWEARWIESMQGDEQLKELEQARYRLIVQSLSKATTEPNIKPLKK